MNSGKYSENFIFFFFNIKVDKMDALELHAKLQSTLTVSLNLKQLSAFYKVNSQNSQ